MPVRVVLEVAPRRAFASALDWPGWSRGAKTPDEAIEALLAYAPRYAPIAARAGTSFATPATDADLVVIQTLEGGSGTEFGVPGATASAERETTLADERVRLVGLMESCWAAFDEAATVAEGGSLRRGPRGGGRQVPKMREHIAEADAAYLHQLGTKVRHGTDVRRAFLETVRLRFAGAELPAPNRVRTRWEPRYAIRRSAWHALDHAWEIEDRLED
jgi:hypothetical protein